MPHVLASYEPEDLHGADLSNGMPSWATSLVEQILAAAAEGHAVSVTSEERMLTPQQMADRLGVNRSTISRKIAAGEISSVKVGNRHRIPYSEYQRYRENMLDTIVRATASDVEAELLGEWE